MTEPFDVVAEQAYGRSCLEGGTLIEEILAKKLLAACDEVNSLSAQVEGATERYEEAEVELSTKRAEAEARVKELEAALDKYQADDVRYLQRLDELKADNAALREALRHYARDEDVFKLCDRSEHVGWYDGRGDHCDRCGGGEPREFLASREPNLAAKVLASPSPGAKLLEELERANGPLGTGYWRLIDALRAYDEETK